MTGVRAFAPAKINWMLSIEGRRPDGFHDLNTIFQALQWGDTLELRPRRDARCVIRCDDPAVPVDEANLAWQAWDRLRAASGGRVGGVNLRLHKRIPAGAGLGGGSSDAAATLAGLNRLYGLGRRRTELMRLASEIGSDCPFFLLGGTAQGRGRGEILKKISNPAPPVWLVIVFPGFTISTAEAYRRVTPGHYEGPEETAHAVDLIAAGKINQLKNIKKNVFHDLAFYLHSGYTELNKKLDVLTGGPPMLCGSGSAVFAWASGRDAARQAAEVLRGDMPISVAVRTRKGGIAVGTLK